MQQPNNTPLDKALENIDWEQVVFNGGPPCFHLEGNKFCLRAERWAGHEVMHAYKPLAELIKDVRNEHE